MLTKFNLILRATGSYISKKNGIKLICLGYDFVNTQAGSSFTMVLVLGGEKKNVFCNTFTNSKHIEPIR
jgi:hypothetical protein